MKKIFTLFAAALIGFCAFAQEQECPSRLYMDLLDGSNINKVEVELLLTNLSQNLNGWNMQIQKMPGSEAVTFRKSNGDYFSSAGYANVILQRWATTMGEDEDTGDEIEIPVTDEMREAKLLQMCDVKSNVKDDKLVVILILSTNDCRFFPVINNYPSDPVTEDAPFSGPTAVGKFFLNMGNCDDGEYEIAFEAVPSGCAFSYTGGDEPSSWTADPKADPDRNLAGRLTLTKEGDKVTTAISTVTIDEQPVDNRIFDLQGRELQSVPEHGIYIQNGKKYVK